MSALKKLLLRMLFIAALVFLLTPVQGQASNNLQQPDPDHPGWIYYQLGLYYQSTGQYEAAIRSFSTALMLQSDMTDAYEARADSYIALERYNLAIGDYTQALVFNSNNSLLYAKRAFAYAACGDLEHGRADFDEIAKSGR